MKEQPRVAWTDEDKNTLRTLWLAGRGSGDIARHLGTVSRNAVMGMINRLGLMGRQGTEPAPDAGMVSETAAPVDLQTLPESDARTLAEEAFGEPYDQRRPGHLSALVTLAAVIVGRDPAAVAQATGLHPGTSATVLAMIDDAGVWRADEMPPRHWIDPRSGTVSFVMDMLVVEGAVERRFDEVAAAWRYMARPDAPRHA